MITELPVARFCSCCSLLCESPSPTEDFGATFCSRRNRELEGMRRWLDSGDSLGETATWESALQQARGRLAQAQHVLVTGRIRCVESSRSALRIAERFDATVDLWESDAAFESIAAFQRSGGMGISLGEARDLSQWIVVIGGDSLLEDYPKLPEALSRGRAVPVLLVGRWSDRGCKPWLDQGFEVLAIDTPIESFPRSLMKASTSESQSPFVSQVSRWLHQSGYTTVLWSLKHLSLDQGDLWVEEMMRWIAMRNEQTRCAALGWGDLESTFQQVCTWWTGFPGRIQYRNGSCTYDTSTFSSEYWLRSFCTKSVPSSNFLILWIDDSYEELPSSLLESCCDRIVVGARQPQTGQRLIWLPSQRAGFGRDSQFFRGDQAILVRGRDPFPTTKELPAVDEWLRGLIEP